MFSEKVRLDGPMIRSKPYATFVHDVVNLQFSIHSYHAKYRIKHVKMPYLQMPSQSSINENKLDEDIMEMI